MTEQAIDELLRNFQRACEEVILAGDSNLNRTRVARAAQRNHLRAALVEGERWRSDFQTTEKTAQELDAQWERLALIVGYPAEGDFRWSEVVDRVRLMKANLLTLAKLATGTPEFFSPVDAWNAKALRDRVLSEAIREVAE